MKQIQRLENIKKDDTFGYRWKPPLNLNKT